MGKTALIPLAEGFEEMEAVILIDVLRRAEVDVTVAGLRGPGPVLGSRGITVLAEADLADHAEATFDAIVLPGGMGGTLALRDDARVVAAVQRQANAGKLTAALCAAPLVLEAANLAKGRRITSHPSVAAELADKGALMQTERVVRDGSVLTSQGPGTAMEFALAIVADLYGPDVARSVGGAMCVS